MSVPDCKLGWKLPSDAACLGQAQLHDGSVGEIRRLLWLACRFWSSDTVTSPRCQRPGHAACKSCRPTSPHVSRPGVSKINAVQDTISGAVEQSAQLWTWGYTLTQNNSFSNSDASDVKHFACRWRLMIHNICGTTRRSDWHASHSAFTVTSSKINRMSCGMKGHRRCCNWRQFTVRKYAPGKKRWCINNRQSTSHTSTLLFFEQTFTLVNTGLKSSR